MIAKAKELDVTVLRGMSDLRAWEADGREGGRVLGLMASDHMSYEIDRRAADRALVDEQPSLKEM